MRNKFTVIFLLIFFCKSVFAQEPHFTQFYATPLFLNPAFTGLTYEHRFSLNYRNQWPGIQRTYVTYMAAYDYNISNLNSGIGIYVLQDVAGTSNLISNLRCFNYAYRVKINKYSEARAGISIAMGSKKIDNSGLIFNDQLVTGSGTSAEAGAAQKVNYFDLGMGALYNTTNFWLGLSAKHLNQPNTSMIDGANTILPTYISVHGGYRHIIEAHGAGKTKLDEFISASLHYRHQENYDQLDIGGYYYKNIMNVGLWYRGLPLKRYAPGYTNRESIAILVGIEIPDKNFRVGYSYDITLSRLGFNNSLGSHELSMVYEVAKKKKRSRRVLVSCPKF
ncbi:MAG TPA: PorP/SprF family type IX secretion system membrane protein [Bacteroidia bacterium]|nr:PorP/SprF family type IX secretion system membrane protein [Bacteroidia bacterium]